MPEKQRSFIYFIGHLRYFLLRFDFDCKIFHVRYSHEGIILQLVAVITGLVVATYK